MRGVAQEGSHRPSTLTIMSKQHARTPQHTAVHFALHVDMAVKPAAMALRTKDVLMRIASAVTPHVEQFVPILLLCPLSSLQASHSCSCSHRAPHPAGRVFITRCTHADHGIKAPAP